MESFNWSLPAIAMVVGVGLGLLLVLTRGLWKSLPGWLKFVVFLAFVVFILLLATGRLPRIPLF